MAGIASASVALANMHGWYGALSAPPFAPLAPLTMAAWRILAISWVMMAMAAWRIWRRMHPVAEQNPALNAWGWQLALGAAWPAAFFGFHAMLTALIIAIGLLLALALTVRRFARLDNAAALLLVPYLIWSGFACYLNAGFWWLNH